MLRPAGFASSPSQKEAPPQEEPSRPREMQTATTLSRIIAVLVSTALTLVAHPARSNQQSELIQNYCSPAKEEPSSYIDIKDYRIESLHVVLRHGDRSPHTVFLGVNTTETAYICSSEYRDLWDPDSSIMLNVSVGVSDEERSRALLFGRSTHFWYGSCERGQLTVLGATQLHRVGKAYRARYGSRMSVSIADMEVRSTDLWRTQQSTQAFLHGFLGNDFAGTRNNAIKLNVVPEDVDTFNPSFATDRGLIALLKQAQAHETYLAYLNLSRRLIEKFERILQYRLPDIHGDSVQTFFTELAVRKCHNYSLPCALSPSGFEECITEHDLAQASRNLGWESMFLYTGWEGRVDVVRHAIGGLLAYFVTRMKARIAHSERGMRFHEDSFADIGGTRHGQMFMTGADESLTSPRMFVMVGRDMTVAALLAALGSNEMDQWPGYGSEVALELWKKVRDVDGPTPRWVVRALVNGRPLVSRDPSSCDLKTVCEAGTFFGLMKEYIELK
ncbi:phosphoglycerate mutase-like protein [Gonapodya prolifera JEL478]|uniref:Phosphoglycerate mutase-like protein n=1 Tax=Gonapodya prolifera (strain JEL478) TaxID=1344416 RepID=A0A138ZY86_GONPJ|nr:phosphoglycerate mutase-like protein [Gonapodya prolifera JEL478]|eukprot:KXS09431.1 phosphoglycerate mutase-like protein [Gonapodya prolifera JEL478]